MTCQTCNGTGTAEWQEFYHDYDGITAGQSFFTHCPDCTGAGICPNCGKELVQADDLDNYNNPYYQMCSCGFDDPLRS